MREGIFGHPASAVFIVLYVLRLVDTKMAVYISALPESISALKSLLQQYALNKSVAEMV